MVAAILEVAVVPYVCAFAIFSKTSESFTPTDKGNSESFNVSTSSTTILIYYVQTLDVIWLILILVQCVTAY